jgi:adenine phosphoribosyltransferase
VPELEQELNQFIRDIPDFPKPGVIFKDITPLLQNAQAFAKAIEWMTEPYLQNRVDYVLGVESRGFVFAAAAAYRLQAGIIPVRKPGKLPWKTLEASYALEYGTDRLQIHQDAVKPGQKVLIVDDVMATGGTAEATCKLVRELGGEIVEACFLIELDFLKGREKLQGIPLRTLIHY